MRREMTPSAPPRWLTEAEKIGATLRVVVTLAATWGSSSASPAPAYRPPENRVSGSVRARTRTHTHARCVRQKAPRGLHQGGLIQRQQFTQRGRVWFAWGACVPTRSHSFRVILNDAGMHGTDGGALAPHPYVPTFFSLRERMAGTGGWERVDAFRLRPPRCSIRAPHVPGRERVQAPVCASFAAPPAGAQGWVRLPSLPHARLRSGER